MPPLAAATRAAASLAFEAGSIADQGEVAAFETGVSLVALEPRFFGPAMRRNRGRALRRIDLLLDALDRGDAGFRVAARLFDILRAVHEVEVAADIAGAGDLAEICVQRTEEERAAPMSRLVDRIVSDVDSLRTIGR